METTITQRRENRLLGRMEVHFTILHENAGTPPRSDIRKAVAGALGVQGGLVILDWARSDFGRTATRGFAKVYTERDRALEVETLPVLVRNGLREAAKKAEAPPAAAPTPPPPKKEAAKPEAPRKEAPAAKAEPPKADPSKKEAPKPEVAKKEAAAKGEKKEAAAPKKEAPAKEKKPAAKREGK